MKRFPSAVPGATVEVGPVVDCHQHVWSEALIEALRRRTACPRLDEATLHLDGEPPSPVQVDGDLATRREQDERDGVDLALLSLSTALGVETLAPPESAPLLDAWHALADELGVHHALWAAVGLVEPDLGALEDLLSHPRVCGLQLPAPALATPEAVERLAPVSGSPSSATRPSWCIRGPCLPDPAQVGSPRGGPR